MKIDYLREFVVLSDELNFSVAATKLFISQSALSRHVSALEEEFGSKLLERDTRKVILTPIGEKMSHKFRKILMEYENLLSDSESDPATLTGSLSVGLLYYAIAEYYSDFLHQFREKYPGIRLEIRNYHPSALYHAMVKNELDIGDMFWAMNLLTKDLVFHKLYPIHMVALLPETHPLAGEESIDLKDLQAETLIDLENDRVSSISTHEIIRKCGVVFQNTCYVEDIEAVPSAVIAGKGIHITGNRVQRQSYPGIRYIPLSNSEAICHHCFVHHTENANPLIPVFIGEAVNYYKDKQ